MVYVPVGGSVYGFRVQDGERINNWEDIHKQTITAVVHPPGSNHVITGSHDLTAKVCAVSHVATLRSHQVSKVCPQDINAEMQLYLAFTNNHHCCHPLESNHVITELHDLTAKACALS